MGKTGINERLQRETVKTKVHLRGHMNNYYSTNFLKYIYMKEIYTKSPNNTGERAPTRFISLPKENSTAKMYYIHFSCWPKGPCGNPKRVRLLTTLFITNHTLMIRIYTMVYMICKMVT